MKWHGMVNNDALMSKVLVMLVGFPSVHLQLQLLAITAWIQPIAGREVESIFFVPPTDS